jgi:hypothetical protein
MNKNDFWERKTKQAERVECRARILTLVTYVGALLLAALYLWHLFHDGFLDNIGKVNMEYAQAKLGAESCKEFSPERREAFRETCARHDSTVRKGLYLMYANEVVKHFVSDMGGDFLSALWNQSPPVCCLLVGGIITMFGMLINHGPLEARRIRLAKRPSTEEEIAFGKKLFAELVDTVKFAAKGGADEAPKEKAV